MDLSGSWLPDSDAVVQTPQFGHRFTGSEAVFLLGSLLRIRPRLSRELGSLEPFIALAFFPGGLDPFDEPTGKAL